jgi:hypothetical protein
MPNNTFIPPIKTPRQYRLLKELATGVRLGVMNIERIAGVTHASALKRDLIDIGWPIGREIISVVDRDGKKTRPSLFYLPDKEWQNKARTACVRWNKKGLRKQPL